MRILGYIDHPQLKITVFKMDNRISVKFENSGYEQTFKLGQDERVAELGDVRKLIDPAFVEAVNAVFGHMHRIRLSGYERTFPAAGGHQFEEII